MGWFGKRTTLTINGDVQSDPETVSSLSRRIRLFVECLRRIQDHPLASPSAAGRPIGDGLGLEELVGRLRPVFAQDAALIPWVALRGAIPPLHQMTFEPDTNTPFVPSVEVAMGVGHIGDIERGDPTVGISPEFAGRLSAQQSEAVLGIYGAVWWRLLAYEEYVGASLDEVKASDLCPNQAISLDIIAWISVALCRLGLHLVLVRNAPAPDLMDRPGWYVEPMFKKCERYWNGQDWTDECLADGRTESIPL